MYRSASNKQFRQYRYKLLALICLSLAFLLEVQGAGKKTQEDRDGIEEDISLNAHAGESLGAGLGATADAEESYGKGSGGGMGNLFGGLLGGKKLSSVEAGIGVGATAGVGVAGTIKEKVPSLVGGGASTIAKEIIKEEKSDLFGLNGIGDWTKFILNPFELVKKIAEHFKIGSLDIFVQKIGGALLFGAEVFLQPLVFSLKIIEKLFVADHCRFRFMCKIGAQLSIMKNTILKFSPSFLSSTHTIKAFSDGIVGQECDSIFPQCEPKLKKNFYENHDNHHHHHEGSKGSGYSGKGGEGSGIGGGISGGAGYEKKV